MESSQAAAVAVFGAYGHTGRFVVSELLDRGLTPILSGRDADKLRALAGDFPGLDVRPTSVDEPASLDRALDGAAAVINCAGPFAATAGPRRNSPSHRGLEVLQLDPVATGKGVNSTRLGEAHR